MGRSTKLTEQLQTRIIEALRSGMTEESAARTAGISPASYWAWKRRAEEALAAGDESESEQKYIAFRDAVARAWDEAHLVLAASVRQAGVPHDVTTTTEVHRPDGRIEVTTKTVREHDWRAAAWILERRHPQEWAKVQQVELTGADGGPLLVAAEVVDRALRLVDQARQRLPVIEIPSAALPPGGEEPSP